MSSSRGAFYLLLIALSLESSFGSTKYYIKLNDNPPTLFKTKSPQNLRFLHYPLTGSKGSLQDEAGTRIQDEDQSASKDFGPKIDRRYSFDESSTFNPDVLNKFLEEYANKIKTSTERNYKYPLRTVASEDKTSNLETNSEEHAEKEMISSVIVHNSTTVRGTQNDLNDTLKRNSYWGGSNSHDDKKGWVTLDAIPWSKSKISKWQANPTSQRPWPEVKPWDKENNVKPWQADPYPSRPSYESNKPWSNRPKPNWPESSEEKPWYSDRPKPNQPMKPYIDRFEENPNQAQIWPPEKPSYNRYPDNYRPTSDIITDERPSNFPSNWDRPQIAKPNYSFADRYTNKNEEDPNDWKNQNYPSKYESHDRPQSYPRPTESKDRPHFSQYQYLNDHPPTHPSSGDGQWILLSTNRGYTKNRQRSIKVDALTGETLKVTDATKAQNPDNDDHDSTVAVMTSRRQVRLTVLPSVNGTNTTTSHGGLLEVERTFKTVDQSQKEYERNKKTPLTKMTSTRPFRNTIVSGNPSNSAILAAVSAGMLPATMAMMIPMMLGRKKRDTKNSQITKVFYLDQGLRQLADKQNNQRTKVLRF
ncbi:uncharacterized protein LOC117167808 [Belonocnema kinseyi]|uniref:uncharacterized protein LOC117167808 n=1 Tax=Belonocnema kinseyi TaxID=2817044 RepID=UPI00143D934B|nr:uncharacterized protein LOC117167808 [Belonocnema kinseyi]XP_033208895.1 uncharacterized protein LOC117167808 [Belonocnema kinseyi]XP_033208896.1 uncharacterized protein LOC117167808 [Belonocnema kinseyi]XP_033208897.1 uncharacterized protein LOC117167808 [Belonocnema kinseyi]XP_033208899.1 uncharacterized protein LOC117167808 [Belonocnema kinseyi]XP_033208900.1 uncharacterized protein LOC117167808 [Belonocnema kinseyi]